jgi:hypothetical protein
LYSAISDALLAGVLELRVRRGLKERAVSVLIDASDGNTGAGGDGLAAGARVGEHRV